MLNTWEKYMSKVDYMAKSMGTPDHDTLTSHSKDLALKSSWYTPFLWKIFSLDFGMLLGNIRPKSDGEGKVSCRDVSDRFLPKGFQWGWGQASVLGLLSASRLTLHLHGPCFVQDSFGLFSFIEETTSC